MGRSDMPRVIAAFLDSGIAWFVGRAILTFVFWGAGLGHLIEFQHSVAELKGFGVEPAGPLNVLLVATLLIGSLLILLDRWLWLGCGILSVFLVVAIVLAYPFWTMQEPARTLSLRVAMEHFSLIGGFMVCAVAGRLRGLKR